MPLQTSAFLVNPNLPGFRSSYYALIQHFSDYAENTKVIEIVESEGTQLAIEYFNKKYPGRKGDGMRVWLLVGGEMD
jgi:hypothetical protein